MNLPVTHARRKGNFESVFRTNCTKMVINFILFYQVLYITKQETQLEMGCRLQWKKTKT